MRILKSLNLKRDEMPFVLIYISLDIIQGPPLVACSILLVYNIKLHDKRTCFCLGGGGGGGRWGGKKV